MRSGWSLDGDVEVGSAGTGNSHVGEAPDRRAQLVARRHGIDIGAYRARQVGRQDFHRFSHIIALDPQNLASLKKMTPSGGTATVSLLLDEIEGRHGQAVADPYYGDQDEFEVTWADVTSAAQRLARRLLDKP